MGGPALGFKSQLVHEMGEKWLDCNTRDKALEISLTADAAGARGVM